MMDVKGGRVMECNIFDWLVNFFHKTNHRFYTVSVVVFYTINRKERLL